LIDWHIAEIINKSHKGVTYCLLAELQTMGPRRHNVVNVVIFLL